jgi:hypothetical protein
LVAKEALLSEEQVSSCHEFQDSIFFVVAIESLLNEVNVLSRQTRIKGEKGSNF